MRVVKILNPEELTHITKCPCGAKLEYTFSDIQYDGTRYCSYEEFIICPNCKRRLLVNIDKPFGKE